MEVAMPQLSRRTRVRIWRVKTAVTVVVATFALVAGGLTPPGPAFAAPPKKPSGAAVAPAGDAGWKPQQAPKSTTADLKSRPGTGGAPVWKPDPKAKRVKELTGKRSANESFFQLSDGSVQQEVSALPVRYRDSKGAWQSIDSSVKTV